MIDLHTHILYGVDDGAKNLKMSMELLEEAEKAGFTKIVFTSHYIEGYFTVDAETRQRTIAEIDNAKNVDIDLYMGNEVFLGEDLIKLLDDKKVVTLNNTKYVLFELPFNNRPINLMDIIFRLQSKNFVPILAHPERYSYFYKDPDIYEELVDKGVLLQVNFGSLGGQYGRRAKLIAEKLLQANLVHFLATDVHRPDSVYPEIPNLLRYATNLVGEEKVKQLTTTNPELVLQNKDIEIEEFDHMQWSILEKFKINRH